MSALGAYPEKAHSEDKFSALPQKPDSFEDDGHYRVGHFQTLATRQTALLFDHLIDKEQQREPNPL
jgi:hypothetical protein